jgi:hypothetical protein
MMTEVNPYIEVVVVPIRFVIAAPLPVPVHPGDIVIDLAAVLAVAAGIAVDSCAIRFQAVVAIFLPIPIRASGTAESQYQPAGHRARQNHPTPEFIVRHDFLPGLSIRLVSRTPLLRFIGNTG